MGQKDSRPAHNAYTQPINDDYSYPPAPNAPKETIESVMRILLTLTPLYPDEALLFEDPKTGRIYFNLPTEYSEEILNILPQGQSTKLWTAHDKAIQRLSDDSRTPVDRIPTPDRPYLMVLIRLKSILRKWKDMYRNDNSDGTGRHKPDDPPPPYAFCPPVPQNADAGEQGRAVNGGSRPRQISSESVLPNTPTLKQASSASQRAPASADCNTCRPSLPLPVLDQDKVSGGRHTAMTKPAQLFESKFQIRFPDVANIMQAYRSPKPTDCTITLLQMKRPFDEQKPEIGFFASTSSIINGDLHLWTDCRVRARTTKELYEILSASKPASWLRPCRHLGADAHHHMPLRDETLSYDEFMTHAQRYGGFAASDGSGATKQRQCTIVSCQYCYTDYNIRARKCEAKDPMSFKTITEYCLDIDVWHNLGAGFDPMESKWLGLAAAASFTTLKVVPLERGLGSVTKAYQY